MRPNIAVVGMNVRSVAATPGPLGTTAPQGPNPITSTAGAPPPSTPLSFPAASREFAYCKAYLLVISLLRITIGYMYIVCGFVSLWVCLIVHYFLVIETMTFLSVNVYLECLGKGVCIPLKYPLEMKAVNVLLLFFSSGLGGVPPGPPMPRPVLPRERGYLDRFIEYLVGDGPANRFALVCRQCESHNGMALKDEFQYLGEFDLVLFQSVHFLTVSWGYHFYLLCVSLSTRLEHLIACILWEVWVCSVRIIVCKNSYGQGIVRNGT